MSSLGHQAASASQCVLCPFQCPVVGTGPLCGQSIGCSSCVQCLVVGTGPQLSFVARAASRVQSEANPILDRAEFRGHRAAVWPALQYVAGCIQRGSCDAVGVAICIPFSMASHARSCKSIIGNIVAPRMPKSTV